MKRLSRPGRSLFCRIQGLRKDNSFKVIGRDIKVATQGNEQPAIGQIMRSVLLAALILVLPGLQWSIFGWLNMFLPLLALYLLRTNGRYTGSRQLLSAVAIAGVVYLFLRSFDLFIFTSILLLSGYVLERSAAKDDKPHVSGMKGVLALTGGWLVVVSALSLGSETSIYGQLVHTFDEGISDALEYYRNSSSISADTLVVLEATLHRMKVIIPIIMPAILGSLILFIVWFTMVTANMLFDRLGQKTPWNEYRFWQLPEKCIWLAIGTGIFALLPLQALRNIGINGLILLSSVYCFQGLSIAVFFMYKWNVPLLLRSFFYVMLIFQSFGTIMLLIVGISDIWFDFRKLKSDAASHNNN
ncbi:MAG: DUF2232 domain-containing protein [Desulforhopalus sp.]